MANVTLVALHSIVYPGGEHQRGDHFEIDAKEGKRLIADGAAEEPEVVAEVKKTKGKNASTEL